MIEPKEIKKQFYELREMVVKESEEEFKLYHESRHYPKGWPEIAHDNIVLSKLGMSKQELEELDNALIESDEKILKYREKHVRPNVLKESDTPNDALLSNLQTPPEPPPDMRIAKPFNCTIVTDDPDLLKGCEGRIHNPWLEPDGAEYQDMIVYYRGRGKGYGRGDERSGHFECDWFYYFMTDPGDFYGRWYRIMGRVDFRGLFSCCADDTPFRRKSARVTTTLKLSVYQFGVRVERTQKRIMDHSGRNIYLFDRRFDGTQLINLVPGVWLRSGTVTQVVLTARIFARARGSGSEAYIDFNKGPTRWVRGHDLWYS